MEPRDSNSQKTEENRISAKTKETYILLGIGTLAGVSLTIALLYIFQLLRIITVSSGPISLVNPSPVPVPPTSVSNLSSPTPPSDNIGSINSIPPTVKHYSVDITLKTCKRREDLNTVVTCNFTLTSTQNIKFPLSFNDETHILDGKTNSYQVLSAYINQNNSQLQYGSSHDFKLINNTQADFSIDFKDIPNTVSQSVSLQLKVWDNEPIIFDNVLIENSPNTNTNTSPIAVKSYGVDITLKTCKRRKDLDTVVTCSFTLTSTQNIKFPLSFNDETHILDGKTNSYQVLSVYMNKDNQTNVINGSHDFKLIKGDQTDFSIDFKDIPNTVSQSVSLQLKVWDNDPIVFDNVSIQ